MADFGPAIDGMRAMTARLNAAFSRVKARDEEQARLLLGSILRAKRRLRQLVGAEVAAELEAIADDLAADPRAFLTAWRTSD